MDDFTPNPTSSGNWHHQEPQEAPLQPQESYPSYQLYQRYEVVPEERTVPVRLRVDSHFEEYPETSFDQEQEPFFGYDSPRPMGPKQLPFDEYGTNNYPENDFTQSSNPYLEDIGDHGYLETPRYQLPSRSPDRSIDSNRNKYRVRRYQNLLQSGTSPFEVLDSSNVESAERADTTDRADRSNRFGSDDEINTSGFNRSTNPGEKFNTPTGQSAPYPVNSDLNNSDDLDVDYSLVSRDPIYGTPTRIPTLVNDLSPEQKTASQPPLSSGSPPFLRTNLSSRSLSSSPELPRYFNSHSPLSSPTRLRSQRSPFTSLTYTSYVSQNRSSRSPSPKKFYADSPSNRTGVYPTEDYLDEFYEDTDFKAPRWSLIEHDYYDQYETELPTPITTNFDYDNLPELPQQAEDGPDRNVTLKSTVSFFRKDDNGLPVSPSMRKKKHDALPPLPLDLPLLPFSSSSLTAQHFLHCRNVWSMREIFAWCVKLSGWLHDKQVPKNEMRKALIKLVVYHKRQIPLDLIGRNVTQILSSFEDAGVITVEPNTESAKNELLITVNPKGEVGGVLVDLTECYCSDEDHLSLTINEDLLKCYSSQCQLNKMIEHDRFMKNTSIHDLTLGTDWANHWQLTAEDINMDPASSKRQSLIFDLIKFEQNFIQRAECFIDIVAPQFIKAASLLAGQSVVVLDGKLRNDIFNSAKELATIHRTLLFEPLLRILMADGRNITNIVGVADLYNDWSKQASVPLLTYMGTVPMIEDLLRLEGLKSWDEPLRQNPRLKELQVNGNLLLMSTFNSRYQQLPLQLSDIRKSFDVQDENYIQLTQAIESIKKLGKKVNEMKVHADNIYSLRVLQKQLTWKSSIHPPKISLSSEKRKLFYRGDLSRKGDLKLNSHTIHLIVLDNYLLITERSRNQKMLNFKVVETPIPMDYLILENREKESGITSKVSTSPNLTKQIEEEEELASYPFKLRYAGRGKYQAHTCLAPSENARNRWFSIFEMARSNMLRRVLPLAPYDLQLIDNSFFAYEPANRITKLPILPINDPVLILARGTTTNLKNRGVSRDIYSFDNPRNQVAFKKIQCSQSFELSGTKFYFLGLSSGVYCSDLKNRWKMIINMNNVTKLTVIPSLNVVLVLANKALRYYPLQLLINIYYERKDKTQSFSLSNDLIQFYEVGCHRGIYTLFVAKKKNTGNTTFKVFSIETDNNGVLSTFSVIKRFYIQAECYGISIFNRSVAVHTQRGFEILDLLNLSPRTIPELPPPDLSSKRVDAYNRKTGLQSTDVIRRAISYNGVKPMGMFRLTNGKEFLLVYNECAILVNASGKLSRTSILKFDFRPKNVAFKDNNLFLVCEEVIEVWSISDFANGTIKLIQVIPSKDITLLNSEQLTFGMANPRVVGLQIAFTLVPKLASDTSGTLKPGNT